MRINSLALLSLGISSVVVAATGNDKVTNGQHSRLRAVSSHRRRLLPDWPYAFLVSQAGHAPGQDGRDWCITAKHGVTDGSDVGFDLCDFTTNPYDQLFMLDAEGKIHSRVDPNQCFVIDDGTAVGGGFRIKFCACNEPVTFTTFEHNRTTDVIRVKNDPSYCIKQTGNGPDVTDTLRTEFCDEDNKCFQYHYREHLCSLSSPDVDCCANSDCGAIGDICEDYQCVCSTSIDGIDCCTNEDCGPGLACNNFMCRTCLDECCNDGDCPIDFSCNSGTCVTPAFFLISKTADNREWCISESTDFTDVTLELCDFTNRPTRQLWHQDTHNMFRSDVNVTRCLIVGEGEEGIFSHPGFPVHMAPCMLNTFLYNSVLNCIHCGQDKDYCLSNHPDAVGNHLMRAQSCQDTDSFKFYARTA